MINNIESILKKVSIKIPPTNIANYEKTLLKLEEETTLDNIDIDLSYTRKSIFKEALGKYQSNNSLAHMNNSYVGFEKAKYEDRNASFMK